MICGGWCALTGEGVRVQVVKESLIFTGENSPMAHLLPSVIGAFAEFERALILEHQREGIAAAKARGRLHRPQTRPHPRASHSAAGPRRRWESKTVLAREFGVSRETVYAYLRADTAMA
jgi:DNA invertase Pin-like site-specific DNA recombinase